MNNRYFIIGYILFIVIVLSVGHYFSSTVEGLDASQITVIGPKDPMPANSYLVSTDAQGNRSVAKIPYGYNLNPDGTLHASTIAAMYTALDTSNNPAFSKTTVDSTVVDNPLTHYDTNNYNVQYHADSSANDSTADNLAQTGTWMIDKNGKKTLVPWTDVSNSITYYQPGSYPFSAANYVPNYEDSVYLSRTTGQSSLSPIYNTASMMGGVCTQYANDPNKLEQICNAVDPDKCASMSCCVLLGGSKCVAGGEKGPTMKVNYSDIFVQNKDVYYYQGKCYGNC